MSSMVEVFKQHREAQNRYSYFLLAAAASAAALSLQRTADSPLSYTMVPLGLAVVCWGLSFYFGCRHLHYVHSVIYANMAALQVQAGTHPGVPNNPEYRSAALEGINQAMESNSNRANKHAHLQFRLLIAGAVLFVVWHVTGMVERTWRADEPLRPANAQAKDSA